MTALPEEAKPVETLHHLSRVIVTRLARWIPDVVGAVGFHYPDDDKFAYPKAGAVVEVYDDALARLKGKTGERAKAARERVRTDRAPIAAALDLINSLRGDLSGPLGVELRTRIASTRAALASALAEKEVAPRAKIRDAVIAIEEAWADIRELDRDLASLYERLIVPPLPDIDELRGAERLTVKLESSPAERVRAVDVHAAIEQGINAPAHMAVLFIAYETKPDHPLVQWRAQALAERGT